MLLIIDNYDSFVFNLARYFRRLGQETLVVRNDALSVQKIRALEPQGIVLSPGPCTPQEAGCSLGVVRELGAVIPMLGVCLGHQTIAAAFGGEIQRAPEPMHGRTAVVEHSGERLFAGLPNPLVVGRYHSLVVGEEKLPPELRVTARTSDRIIMAIEHASWPIFGVQFHPESILTEAGYPLLANWLTLAGMHPPVELPSVAEEGPQLRQPPADETPRLPVTF